MRKPLIVYYSRKGENYWNGQIKNQAKGNTEIVDEMIAGLTGGDLFEVQTVQDYAADYYACTDQAKAELQQNARPALKRLPEHLEQYDTIFVGYPNWWGTMPMALFTLLEGIDLSGKRILPFCTNEGSGMGHSEADIRKLCPDAKLGKGLAVTGSKVKAARPELERWLKRNQQI